VGFRSLSTAFTLIFCFQKVGIHFEKTLFFGNSFSKKSVFLKFIFKKVAKYAEKVRFLEIHFQKGCKICRKSAFFGNSFSKRLQNMQKKCVFWK